MLLLKPAVPIGADEKEDFLASISFALQRGMQVLFQVEEQEIAVGRIWAARRTENLVLGSGRRRQRNLDPALVGTDGDGQGC